MRCPWCPARLVVITGADGRRIGHRLLQEQQRCPGPLGTAACWMSRDGQAELGVTATGYLGGWVQVHTGGPVVPLLDPVIAAAVGEHLQLCGRLVTRYRELHGFDPARGVALDSGYGLIGPGAPA